MLKLIITLTTFCIFLPNLVFADKLCVKKRLRVNNNSIKSSKLLKVEGDCPKRFIEVLDTDTFKGEKGDNAFALNTIPPGTTLKGSWRAMITATAFGQIIKGDISFPIPAGTTPTFGFVSSTTTDENCTGTAISPTAEPGFLCIYEATKDKATPNIILNMNAEPGVDKFGATVLYTSTESGLSFAFGSWAYTEPTG